MNNESIIFYILSAVLLVSGVLAVTGRRILRAAVFLLFALSSIAALYFLLGFFFLAAVQIIVYIGGIVVLIIFSILLTHHIEHRLKKPSLNKMLMSALGTMVGAGACLLTIWNHPFPEASNVEPITTMDNIGTKMLGFGEGGYVLPFELISVLLLTAMIAVIVIAKRKENLPS
ncbi:MAG: NADH-quinone oxidoreductase subunit J [Chitinophagales bacterium]|nr:NADH-quinone oxidoreductase subunit J [Chitinophagales bacterium]